MNGVRFVDNQYVGYYVSDECDCFVPCPDKSGKT